MTPANPTVLQVSILRLLIRREKSHVFNSHFVVCIGSSMRKEYGLQTRSRRSDRNRGQRYHEVTNLNITVKFTYLSS